MRPLLLLVVVPLLLPGLAGAQGGNAIAPLVLSPDATTAIGGGQVVRLVWRHFPIGSSLRILLVRSNTTNPIIPAPPEPQVPLLQEDLVNNGTTSTFDWLVPLDFNYDGLVPTGGLNFQIFITQAVPGLGFGQGSARPANTTASSAAFRIRNVKSRAVVAPAGGEILFPGVPFTVMWEDFPPATVSYRVRLALAGTSGSQFVANADLAFDVTVAAPAVSVQFTANTDFAEVLDFAGQMRIDGTLSDGSVVSSLSGTFNFPVLVVQDPVSTDNIGFGAPFSLSWVTQNVEDAALVMVLATADGTSIVSSQPADFAAGSAVFQVPAGLSGTHLLGAIITFSFSSSVFFDVKAVTLVPPITITAPVAAQQCARGQTCTVTWDAAKGIEPVDISLVSFVGVPHSDAVLNTTSAKGRRVLTIAENVAAATSFPWQVPTDATLNDEYAIVVELTGTASVSDVSDRFSSSGTACDTLACANGGACVDDACVCSPGFAGPTCAAGQGSLLLTYTREPRRYILKANEAAVLMSNVTEEACATTCASDPTCLSFDAGAAWTDLAQTCTLSTLTKASGAALFNETVVFDFYERISCAQATCLACLDTAAATCVLCEPPLLLQNGTCVTACDPGFEPLADNVTCGACGAGLFKATVGAQPCTPVTACLPVAQLEVAAPTPSSDRVCANVTDCQPGTAETTAATPTSDRVCTACTLGVDFQNATNAPACLAVSAPCAAGSVETAAPTTSSDRACAPCAAGTFQDEIGATGACKACVAPAEFQDEVGQGACKATTTCVVGEEETAAPSAQSDRACVACGAGTFQDVAGDPACKAVTPCQSGFEQVAAPTASSDAGCQACAPGTFQAEANQTSCSPHADCSPGSFVTANGTATADRTCSPCAADTFQAGLNQDTCAPVTVCAVGEGAVGPPTLTSDRSCAACPAGFFQDTAGTGPCNATRVCAPGEQQTAAPTPTSDTVCEACGAGTFQSAAGQTTCTPLADCGQGSFVMVEPTTSSDRECGACVPGTTFQDEFNQAACKPITVCPVGTAVANSPNAFTDTLCGDCDDGTTFQDEEGQAACKPVTPCANASFFEASPPNRGADRVCSAATPACAATEYEGAAPTATSDRVCFTDACLSGPCAADETCSRNDNSFSCGGGGTAAGDSDNKSASLALPLGLAFGIVACCLLLLLLILLCRRRRRERKDEADPNSSQLPLNTIRRSEAYRLDAAGPAQMTRRTSTRTMEDIQNFQPLLVKQDSVDASGMRRPPLSRQASEEMYAQVKGLPSGLNGGGGDPGYATVQKRLPAATRYLGSTVLSNGAYVETLPVGGGHYRSVESGDFFIRTKPSNGVYQEVYPRRGQNGQDGQYQELTHTRPNAGDGQYQDVDPRTDHYMCVKFTEVQTGGEGDPIYIEVEGATTQVVPSGNGHYRDPRNGDYYIKVDAGCLYDDDDTAFKAVQKAPGTDNVYEAVDGPFRFVRIEANPSYFNPTYGVVGAPPSEPTAYMAMDGGPQKPVRSLEDGIYQEIESGDLYIQVNTSSGLYSEPEFGDPIYGLVMPRGGQADPAAKYLRVGSSQLAPAPGSSEPVFAQLGAGGEYIELQPTAEGHYKDPRSGDVYLSVLAEGVYGPSTCSLSVKKGEAIYEEIDTDKHFIRVPIKQGYGNPTYGLLGPQGSVHFMATAGSEERRPVLQADDGIYREPETGDVYMEVTASDSGAEPIYGLVGPGAPRKQFKRIPSSRLVEKGQANPLYMHLAGKGEYVEVYPTEDGHYRDAGSGDVYLRLASNSPYDRLAYRASSKKAGAEPIYEDLDAATHRFVRLPAPVQPGLANPTYGQYPASATGARGGSGGGPIYATIPNRGRRGSETIYEDLPASVVPLYQDLRPFSKHDTYMTVADAMLHPADGGYMEARSLVRQSSQDPQYMEIPTNTSGGAAAASGPGSVANPIYQEVQVTGL